MLHDPLGVANPRLKTTLVREGLQGGTRVGLPSVFPHKKSVFTAFALNYRGLFIDAFPCIFFLAGFKCR